MEVGDTSSGDFFSNNSDVAKHMLQFLDIMTLGSWAQTCRSNQTLLSQKLAPVKEWWNEVRNMNQVREEDWKRICYLKVKVLNWNSGQEEIGAFRMACAGFREALANHGGRQWGGFLVPPLNEAIKAKDDASTHLLLDGGMDPRELNVDGYTALHLAAINGCTSVVETLLAGEHSDSLINAQCKYGWTALHYAAYHNHPTIVTLLLKHDHIKINIMNHYVGTPLKIAINKNNTKCADMIREAEG